MMKHAPEWVRTRGQVFRSEARYPWTTTPASLGVGPGQQNLHHRSLGRGFASDLCFGRPSSSSFMLQSLENLI